MSAYTSGRRVGYVHVTVSRDKYAGKPAYRAQETMRFTVRTGKVAVVADISDTVYADERFSPVFETYTETMKSPMGKASDLRVEAGFHGSRIDCRIVSKGKETKESIEVPPGKDLIPETLYGFRSKPLKVGDTMHIAYFDPASRSIVDMQRKVVRQERVETEAGVFDALLAVDTDGGKSSMWVLPSGEKIKSIEPDEDALFVRTSREKALLPPDPGPTSDQLRPGIDKPAGRSTPFFTCDREIGDPTLVTELKVRFVGVSGDDTFARDQWQTVVLDPQNKSTVITVTARGIDPVKSVARPIQGKSFAEWLEPTDDGASDRKLVADQAREIVGAETNAYRAACAIRRWVYQRMKPSFTSDTPLAAGPILRSMTGDCKHSSILMTALSRSVGIPTRMLDGLVCGRDGGFRGHVWVECYVGEWVRFDATRPLDLCDATHVAIANPGRLSSTPSGGKAEVLGVRGEP